MGLSVVSSLQPSGEPAMEYSDEEVRGRFPGVELVMGSGAAQGAGALFLTTKRVVWVSEGTGSNGTGYAADFRSIAVHAVSRDPEVSARDCIYIQLDCPDPRFNEEEDEEGEGEAGTTALDAELRLVPAQPQQVEEIFRLLSECAALNPDSDDGDSEEGTFFYNVDSALASVAAADMENAMEELEIEDGQGDLDELVGDDPERFQDAEEEEDPRPNGWTRH
ncbi:unnamed protein product [Ostreobium quekettii]|uniref:Chloride conductance regulatory protein ICln n=1 Tax=Ostreobium quekettii TaxID=121088 RepID=A0A8S1ILG5_9CHLO|nr:unnamed protein product [Ostreobium quekettii]